LSASWSGAATSGASGQRPDRRIQRRLALVRGDSAGAPAAAHRADGDRQVVTIPTYANSRFVADVLRAFALAQFGGAPAHLGFGSDASQRLSYIPGWVARSERELSERQVVSLGRLLREAHDVSADFVQCAGREVICHGDPGPHNTVFVGTMAVGLIAWEFAHPGTRGEDLADAAWCLVQERCADDDWREAGARLGALCQGYGHDDVAEVLDAAHAAVHAAAERYGPGSAAAAAHFSTLSRWLERRRSALLHAALP
jgi:hypothetical protein